MIFFQKTIILEPRKRGFHLVTNEIINGFDELKKIKVGIFQAFIQHTSASLSINENADPTVRKDLEYFLNYLIPEEYNGFEHIYEGLDDMPAHIKVAFLGNSVQIPIKNGQLLLGTWQGIYLGEHRNDGGNRKLILSAWGE